MLKTAYRVLKKSISALAGLMAGLLGGLVAGLLITLLIYHIKFHYHVELPSIWLTAIIVISLVAVMGLVMPAFFMPYFICPLSWMLSDSDAPDLDFAGSDCDSCSAFFIQLCYFLGAPLLLIGCVFSLPYIVLLGAAGIGVFTCGIHAVNRKPKCKLAKEVKVTDRETKSDNHATNERV